MAAHHASQALAIPHTCAYPELEANYAWLPHSILYWSLFWLDRKEDARRHWEAFRSSAPPESWPEDHARLFPLMDATAHRAIPEARVGGAGQVC